MEKLRFISSILHLASSCFFHVSLPLPATSSHSNPLPGHVFFTILLHHLWLLSLSFGATFNAALETCVFSFHASVRMSVVGQRFLLHCKLLERRGAACSVLVSSAPGVIPELCQLTVAQPTSDRTRQLCAWNAEAGEKEGISPGLLADEHSVDRSLHRVGSGLEGEDLQNVHVHEHKVEARKRMHVVTGSRIL